MQRSSLVLFLAAGGLAVTLACSSDVESRGAEDRDDSPAARAFTAADLERGRELYKVNCSACHGLAGKGDGPAAAALKPRPRDHTDAAYMRTLTDDLISRTIRMGGAISGKPLMPSSPQIRDRDLEVLVAFVRSLSETPPGTAR